MWKLDKRKIIAMLIGTVLYAPLMHTLIFVPDYNSYIYPATLISLFFGLMYGPWVGLIVGGAGTFIDNFVSLQGHFPMWVAWNPWQSMEYAGLSWEHTMGFALVGFIAGLSVEQTQGRFYTKDARDKMLFFGTAAVFVGLAFSFIFPLRIIHDTLSEWLGDAIVTTVFDMFGLAVLVACCNIVMRNRKVLL